MTYLMNRVLVAFLLAALLLTGVAVTTAAVGPTWFGTAAHADDDWDDRDDRDDEDDDTDDWDDWDDEGLAPVGGVDTGGGGLAGDR